MDTGTVIARPLLAAAGAARGEGKRHDHNSAAHETQKRGFAGYA